MSDVVDVERLQLAASCLTPELGMTETAGRLVVTSPLARMTAVLGLRPGWYEIAIGIASEDRFAVRKRVELILDSADELGKPTLRESFAWNQSFTERFVVKLARPTSGVRLELRHAEGAIRITDCSIRPVSRGAIVRRAVAEKVRLTLAYRCFGAALKRGGRMLVQGRFRDFGSKMMKGLSDSRAMQLGTVEISEVNGAWWRRHALPHEEADRIRSLVDDMADPPPLSIVLPIDNLLLDPARLSAHSVRRQLYPHWHLYLAASGGPELEPQLERLLGNDPRVTIVRVPKWAGRAAALSRIVTQCRTDRLLVLPPGVELVEHALYHLAAKLKDGDVETPLGCRIAAPIVQAAAGEPSAVWFTPTRELSDEPPETVAPAALAAWAGAERGMILVPILAQPIDDRPLIDRSIVGKVPVVRGKTLWLGADLRGLGGYDHVTYAFLRGLPSAGAELRRHQISAIRCDLVPPALMPPLSVRKPGDPQLVVGPPFLVARFGLDQASAVYTMWETNELDPDWIPLLNKAGLIIVPSNWQREAFRANGITAPLAVAPLGFDPLVYHPRVEFPTVCTFGTAGALAAGGLRKNAQWVIDLFRKAFPTETDVKLRIKISPGSPGIETYDDPRIDVLRAVLPNVELADWYRSLTAYANGSFGEGFGLHLIEAMACGRTLVTPCHSGLTAFFDPSLGYAVDYKLIEAKNEIYRGHWAEPNSDSFLAQLRAVYADQAKAARLGDACAARAKRFTWKAAGMQLVQVLRDYEFLGEGTS